MNRLDRDQPAALLASMASQAEAKAANHAYSEGIWRAGNTGGCIVTDSPGPCCGPMDADSLRYYGGHLIAESITPSNLRRILACVNACAGVPTAHLELCASWADIVKTTIHRSALPTEAALVGASLDGDALEQGEPA